MSDQNRTSSERIVRPSHVKFRRETEGGLVYDHENYGYEDATLTTVDGVVIDVLERVERGDGCRRSALDDEFGAGTVDTLLEAGILTHE
ncbi:MAG: mycofactocin biosynthesis chaperone MftB2 [Halobacteriales archaeon]|jgi:putative mycofactocin binding protein MftB